MVESIDDNFELPDEGEALTECTDTKRVIGKVARSGAEMWRRRPEPVRPDSEEELKGAAINTIFAI